MTRDKNCRSRHRSDEKGRHENTPERGKASNVLDMSYVSSARNITTREHGSRKNSPRTRTHLSPSHWNCTKELRLDPRHGLTPSRHHSLAASLPRGLTPSWHHSLAASLPRGITPSWYHSLAASFPRGITPSWYHSLVASISVLMTLRRLSADPGWTLVGFCTRPRSDRRPMSPTGPGLISTCDRLPFDRGVDRPRPIAQRKFHARSPRYALRHQLTTLRRQPEGRENDWTSCDTNVRVVPFLS